MRKKVLIIYTDPYLAYSPTTLNLYNILSESFDVQIIAFEPDTNFSSVKLDEINVRYLQVSRLSFWDKVTEFKLKLLKWITGYRKYQLASKKSRVLIPQLRDFDGEIIAIDFFALWCVQQAGKTAHLLSLEIYESDKYRANCGLKSIKSVIIQTKERFDYLFKDLNLETFYIQNSPVYVPGVPDNGRERTKLIFCGSAVPAFGIFSCIEFIRDFEEYSLTIKGAIPKVTKDLLFQYHKDLIESDRLVLNDEYLDADQLNKFLNQFRIGFVFYDFNRFDFVNKINYHTAPSGKLFQYYNAGVPVIGNNLVGLNSIAEWGAGVMINSLGSYQIKKAIDIIEENYEEYAAASKEASRHFDFRQSAEKFSTYLLNN